MNSSAPAMRAASTTSLERRVGRGGRDVVADGAAEQEVLLQHDADAAAQMGEVDVADVDAVEADHALLGRLDALDQARHRRLARSASARRRR